MRNGHRSQRHHADARARNPAASGSVGATRAPSGSSGSCGGRRGGGLSTGASYPGAKPTNPTDAAPTGSDRSPLRGRDGMPQNDPEPRPLLAGWSIVVAVVAIALIAWMIVAL